MVRILFVVIGLALLVGCVVFIGLFSTQSPVETLPEATSSLGEVSPKNASYSIDGRTVTLVDGEAQTEIDANTSAQIITRYFGNELKVDLDADGVEDVAFILTQETGGSGIFFYAVGAVLTDGGYVGTDGYLLGDRIAPQSTDLSPNPRHKNVVVFNYQDRAIDEPVTTQPSISKSAYLKLVPETMRWAIVEPNFEGESW